ncbi:hypothetical protein PENSPDRAFT_297873 [Peniophora sp. CONT]|nr:hypothetical protein PENSPDRAFT_297873 [Peniophora sp. CONT]
MNVDSKPQRSELSVVQLLPTDVLFELFSTAAVLDPPIRKKHQIGGGWTTFPRRADSPRERLGPAWSRLSEGHRKHEETAKLSTYCLWDSPPTLGWIRLTHVCQQWRTVGLSMAQLWGEVFPVFPLAAETVMARSRGRPLSLDMDLVGAIEYPRIQRSRHVVRFFELARQNVPRARVLTFAHFHSHYPDWHVMPFVGLHLPFLERLRVGKAQETIDPCGPPMQAPALTHLILGAFLPFSAPALR